MTIIEERTNKLIENLENKKGKDFSLVSGFTAQREPALFRHNVCGHEWETKPVNILRAPGKLGCPNCQYRAKSISTEEYSNKLYKLHGDEYTLVEGQKYVNNSTKLLFNHNSCGTVFSTRPRSMFVNEISCPYCFSKQPSKKLKTTDSFSKELQEKHSGEYALVEGSEYKDALSKVRVTHTLCGYTWDVRASHILHTSGCPVCQSSKGEKLVKELLNRYEVSFLQEHTFEDCRNTRPLPFDFALTSQTEVIGIIEYDGIQHYKPFEYFGGESKFKETKANDIKKTNYCKDNGIPLLRIEYTSSKATVERLVKKFIDKVEK